MSSGFDPASLRKAISKAGKRLDKGTPTPAAPEEKDPVRASARGIAARLDTIWWPERAVEVMKAEAEAGVTREGQRRSVEAEEALDG